jgi:hypothetical protein
MTSGSADWRPGEELQSGPVNDLQPQGAIADRTSIVWRAFASPPTGSRARGSLGRRSSWGARCPGTRGPAGAPRGLRRGGARAEAGADLVDHRRLRDGGNGAHHAVAAGARELVDFQPLLEQGCPGAAGVGRRESGRGDDGVRPVCGAGCRLVLMRAEVPCAHPDERNLDRPAREIGVP